MRGRQGQARAAGQGHDWALAQGQANQLLVPVSSPCSAYTLPGCTARRPRQRLPQATFKEPTEHLLWRGRSDRVAPPASSIVTIPNPTPHSPQAAPGPPRTSSSCRPAPPPPPAPACRSSQTPPGRRAGRGQETSICTGQGGLHVWMQHTVSRGLGNGSPEVSVSRRVEADPSNELCQRSTQARTSTSRHRQFPWQGTRLRRIIFSAPCFSTPGTQAFACTQGACATQVPLLPHL